MLGAGGMGVVYEAEDLNLGRRVALKVLPTAFARDAERMARFEREAKVLALLNHPNIASIYGLEDSGGTQALVMELVAGPTLAERIRSGPLPIDEALRIAKQIAEALEYAHERGIVHRDLKPANAKVTSDDMVKVLDFGLAKAIEGDASSMDMANSPTISRMATQAGVILGTAAYMSPEQAKGKPVDRRADIWAFGCVFYEMLTGEMAFRGEDVTETLAAVIRGEPDWSRLPAATPVRVRVLLERCLRKDPKQRLRDIGDARISLDETLSGAPEPVPAGAPQAAAPRWRRALPWALFGIAVAVAAALAFVHFRQKPIAAAAVRLELPLPKDVALSGSGSFALSPDGRKLAFYAAGSEGVMRLWVRSMDSLTARPLPGSEGGQQAPIFWSPDSRDIAFGADGELKKIDLTGDPAETLCAFPGDVVGGSWNRAGVILFGSSAGIMRVSADGGAATPVTALDRSRSETAHVLPIFLPDGRHFLYKRRSSKAGTSGIYIGSLDAKPNWQDAKQLLASDYGAVYAPPSGPGSGSGMGRLLFLRDGVLMAQLFDASRLALVGDPVTVAERVGSFRDFGFFAASNGGTLVYRTGGGGNLQLTWFDRQGKVLGTAGDRGLYRRPALSPDGTQAAVGLRDLQTGKLALWLIDFSRGTSTRFTFGSADTENPIWSPDGKRILFASNPDGHFDLYQKPANGATGEELLLKSDETKFATSVSRDGRFLLYYSIDPKTQRDLWVLPLEGDKKPFLFLRTASNESDGHFSPDGQWVAYVSDESGRNEIYLRRFSPGSAAAGADTGGKWQVSYGGGLWPQWSKDEKELYYLTPDNKVMAVAVSTNQVFQAGAAKLLFQAPPQAGGTFGDYTADGKRFLFLAPAQQTGQAPFNVVLNWQTGLKK